MMINTILFVTTSSIKIIKAMIIKSENNHGVTKKSKILKLINFFYRVIFSVIKTR